MISCKIKLRHSHPCRFTSTFGNHDTTPKTREQFVIQFADWLDKPDLHEQRLRDDPRAHKLTTYYHWIKDGIDFINLDNATDSEFDNEQIARVEKETC